LRHAFSIADCYAPGKKGTVSSFPLVPLLPVQRLITAQDVGEATGIGSD
jgi:hypothetical protein